MLPRLALLASVGLLASCAASGDVGPAPSAPVSAGRSDAQRTLGAGRSGLVIRQWRVEDDADRVATALLVHADGTCVGEDVAGGLERNGLRFVRIPVAQVDGLLADLGGASLDVDGWHGQAYDWRALASLRIGPAGRALAVDGHLRRLHGGKLSLLVRGWTAQMEDGPSLYFEMLTEFDQTRQSRLDQMLGRRAFVGERFHAAGLTMLMEPGFAYVLTAAVPESGASARIESAEGPGPDPAPPPPADGLGPAFEAPPTIGQVLLRRSVDLGPMRRDVFVFVPRIPPELHPAAAAVAEGRAR